MSLPDAVPAFRAHFTDPIYDDPADEMAPFGSDEGSDVLAIWSPARGAELGPDSTIATVLEMSPETLQSDVAAMMTDGEGEDEAAMIRGAAFTLLRLTGRISENDRALALEALDFEIEQYGEDPALLTQRRDLQSWTNPA